MSITLRSLNRDIHWRGSKAGGCPLKPPDLFFFSLTPRFRVPKEGRLLCRVPLQSSITPNPFFIRRGFNHSLNLSPIFGKRLNRSSCRSYIKVSSDHQRSRLFFLSTTLNAGRLTLVDDVSVGSDHPLELCSLI